MVEVSKDDRKAAALIVISREAEQRILGGKSDTNCIVQAFARHRIEATATLQAERDRYRVALEEIGAFVPRDLKIEGHADYVAQGAYNYAGNHAANIARTALSDTPTVQS